MSKRNFTLSDAGALAGALAIGALAAAVTWNISSEFGASCHTLVTSVLVVMLGCHVWAVIDSKAYLPVTRPFWEQQRAGLVPAIISGVVLLAAWTYAAVRAGGTDWLSQVQSACVGLLVSGVVSAFILQLAGLLEDPAEVTGLHLMAWGGRYLVVPLVFLAWSPTIFGLWVAILAHTVFTGRIRTALADSPGSTLSMFDFL